MDLRRLTFHCALAVGACIALPGCWRATPPPIHINEILASNGAFHADQDGDYSDWIEIFNAGPDDTDLAGWRLSDDPENSRQWIFPARTIRAGGYLLVFASGKDRRPARQGELHTNFSLRANGEFLGLYPPGQTDAPASALSPAFPAQRRDISYGRRKNTEELAYFDMPSPGIPNGLAGAVYAGLCAPVSVTPGRGIYAQPQTITLASEDPEAQIRFTLDGADPMSENANLYTQPINVNQSATIRAAAFCEGKLPAPVVSHTFLVGEPAERLSLPVIALSGDPQQALYEPDGIMAIAGGAWVEDAEGQILWTRRSPEDYNNALERGQAFERRVSLEVFDSARDAPVQIDGGLRVHGGFIRQQYSRADDWTACPPAVGPYPKFSFRLYFRNRYGADWLNHALIPQSPANRFDRLVLRGGYQDVCNPFIKDELIRRLHQDMGGTAAMGMLASLYINGGYKGYYNVTERLDESFFQQRYDSDLDWQVVVEGVPDEKTGGPALAELIARLETDPAGAPAIMKRAAAWLDVDDFIDYLILQIYCANQDWPDRNWVAARERSDAGRFRFYVWDSEAAMLPRALALTALDSFTFLEAGLSRADTEISRIYRRLAMDPDFPARFQDRVRRHFFNEGALTPAKVAGRFAELERDMRGVLDDFDTWIGDVFAQERSRIVLQAFREAGLFEVAAPQIIAGDDGIRCTNPNGIGAIWLTLDGADPRQTGTVLAAAEAPKSYLVPLGPQDLFTDVDAGFDILRIPRDDTAPPVLEQNVPDQLGRRLEAVGRLPAVQGVMDDSVAPARAPGRWDTTFLGTAYVPQGGPWSFAVEGTGSFALQVYDLHLSNAGLGGSGRSFDDTEFLQAGLYPVRLDHYGRGPRDSIALLAAPGSAEDFDGMFFAPVSSAARTRPYPVTAWHHPLFDDELWQSARGSIGYGETLPFDTDVRAQLYDRGTSCLLRIPFDAAEEDIATMTQLVLNLRCSHEFAVYLNGWRVAPRDLPFEPQWDSVGRYTRTVEELTTPKAYDITRYRGLLRAGGNLLGVHVMMPAPKAAAFLTEVSLVAHAGDQHAPGAIRYDGPIPAESAATLRARVAVEDGTLWSPLASISRTTALTTTGEGG